MSDLLEFDVIISGAGPAGTSCAIHLIESGLKIAIIEKSEFPRDKICGGGLSDRATNALKRMPFDIWNNFLNNCNHLPIEGISITSPKQETATLSCPATYGYTIKRKEFDAFLLSEAMKSKNIKLFQNEKSISFEYSKDKIIVKTSRQKIKAKLLIIADGFNSLLVKKTELINYKAKDAAVCIQSVFQNSLQNNLTKNIELYYPSRCLPLYFWFFPLHDGTVNIGFGVKSKILRKEKKHILEIYQDLLSTDKYVQQKLSGMKQISEPQINLLPIQKINNRYSTKNIMITGTAAMLVDPISGEGIGNAMLSGEFAAIQTLKCFRENNFQASFIKNYDASLKRRLSTEFRRNRILLELFNFEWLINKSVKKVNKNIIFKNKIEEMLIKNSSRWKLLNPFFYWG